VIIVRYRAKASLTVLIQFSCQFSVLWRRKDEAE
jgi:hypothetical protein